MIKLSAVIITYNEEKKIERCIQSLVKIADEIIIVDSCSTDKTKEICKTYNVKFIEQPFLGYKQQKNFAFAQAKYDYVLSLDGDEALSHELTRSILEVKKDFNYDGYYVNRFNNYCGQWIKYSNWYPDRKLRLFKKGKGYWGGINPHDNFKMFFETKTARLKGDLLHWNYATYEEFDLKTDHFSSISAQSYYDLGRKAPIWRLIVHSSWAFFKSYILRKGFLDGFNGFVICFQTAKITYLKYSKLRQLYKKYPYYI